jgi:hypothetical protein
MSPVAPSGGHAGRALAVGTVSVILVMAVLFGASVVLGNRKSADVRLGDQTFDAGRAAGLAAEVAHRGPLLLPDVSGANDRDAILQHLGRDPQRGWTAFLGAPPDRARNCFWEWQRAARRFRARCDHRRTAPADGAGLPQFRVTVTGGHVVIDLNAEPRRPATTTTAAPVDRPSTTAPGR